MMTKLFASIGILCGVVSLVGLPAFGQEAKPKPKIIAYFPLHGSLAESPSELAMLFSGEQAKTLRTFVKRLEKARTDEAVTAVAISLGTPYLGWAQMQELRRAITRLKTSKKQVYVFLEEAGTAKYLIACAGGHITMVPSGEMFLPGLFSEQAYFKGLLDKLGLQADMMHMGAYKGAAEPFTQSEPSPEAKEQLAGLLGDLYEQTVEMVAASRSLPEEDVKRFMDSGKFSSRAALNAGLIDALGYRQDFLENIRKQVGRETEIKRNYGLQKGPELDFSNPLVALRSLSRIFQITPASKKTSIAIVYANGPIVTGPGRETMFGTRIVGSSTLRKALDEAGKDESIKAVVLRVDSPGGSALASDIILHATERLARKKPFVVSMGNVAASGGYYISCNAQTIFADPATITGSIGVVGGKLVTMPMWNKIGLTFHETKFGKYADIMNTNRPFSEEERPIVMSRMEQVYETFKQRVVDGRKDRLKGDIEGLAGGRVYTGRQAREKGLVDRLGGLNEAIRHAAELAKIDIYKVRILPKPRTLMDLFLEGIGGGDNEEVHVKLYGLGKMLTEGRIGAILTELQQIDPARTAALVRGLVLLNSLREEHVLMAMPEQIVIR